MIRPPPQPTLFPYTTLFRSTERCEQRRLAEAAQVVLLQPLRCCKQDRRRGQPVARHRSTDARAAPGDLLADQHAVRSEEHTSELQSRFDLVCRLLLEKKKNV